jgi:[citrate (pro-3S)-lyase] ligase
MKETLELLAAKRVPVYFINRVGLEKDPAWRYAESAMRRMENGLDFPTMYDAPELYETDLRELFGDKYSAEYIEAMGRIPQIVRTGNSYRHLDCNSDFINIVGGRRVTCHQPGTASRTLHIYGRCGAFGYAVEDADTLPSRIQEELLRVGYSDIRVVNHGLWGASDILIDENFMRDAPGMGANDIVLFYRKHPDKRLIPQLEKVGLLYFDITKEWHQAPEAKWCFYDRPGHMNRIGYQIAARIIVSRLVETKFQMLPTIRKSSDELKTPHLASFLKSQSNDIFLQEIHDYVNSILAAYPRNTGEICGAIVMNCNPFTNGHRYLIEFAAGKVDRLYIFVVQEDKSFFRFEDRFRMVKEGTKDIPNVIVVPSGNFIISSLTFPEYFMKDYVKEKNFDVSSDIRTFCEHIAPALDITIRFVGEELTDPVTANYNRCMHDLLPQYGMSLCEISRLRKEDGTAVSATEVRDFLAHGNLLTIEALVPESTLQVIKERYWVNVCCKNAPNE